MHFSLHLSLQRKPLTLHVGRNQILFAFLSVQLVERRQIVVEFGFNRFPVICRAHDLRIGLQALQSVADVPKEGEESLG